MGLDWTGLDWFVRWMVGCGQRDEMRGVREIFIEDSSPFQEVTSRGLLRTGRDSIKVPFLLFFSLSFFLPLVSVLVAHVAESTGWRLAAWRPVPETGTGHWRWQWHRL